VVQERLSHSIEDYGLTPESIRKMETKMTNAAKKRLKKQIEKFKPSEGLEVLGEVVIGIPSEEILQFQQEKGIDLIIISSLGNTGLAKYFIGSVARNVLKGSTCPVLLTK
jgi:nucleotide-binding universal stress UspA family protein